MRRVLFIYNRRAGKSKTWASLSDIIDGMTAQGCLVTAYPTQGRGDAAKAIVRWAAEYDQLVIAGGDGTLSGAMEGVLKLEKPPVIGYIPVGTTNDFSNSLDLPVGDFREIAITAVTGKPVVHDLGRFNGRSFLYVAAFGAFTKVSYSTPQNLKNALGFNAYMLEGIKELGSLKPYHARVKCDGKVVEGDYLIGLVTNATAVGHFRNFPPGNPDLSDGLLEVSLISPIRDLLDLEAFSRALLTNDTSVVAHMITTFKGRDITITTDVPLPWTLDGEDGGVHERVDITVIDKACTVLHGKPKEVDTLST